MSNIPAWEVVNHEKKNDIFTQPGTHFAVIISQMYYLFVWQIVAFSRQNEMFLTANDNIVIL